jgi:Spy/CpxP family protein refolding chaperone
MTLNWKILTVFTGIFIAGAVAGGFVSARMIRHFAEKRFTPDQFGPQQMKKFTEQLNLTPEQREKIRPVILQTGEDLKKVRRDAFKATTELFERMEAGIARELTDEQRARLREIQEKERERRKQWMLERAKRGDARPGSGPDGAPPVPPSTPSAPPAPVAPPAPAT